MMCQSTNWPLPLATALPIPYIGHIERDTPPPLLQTMRKIETLMNAAISEGKDFKLDNTQVVTINDVSFVYLHDNLIAQVDDKGIVLYDGGYQSNTTKSRLNAILSEHGIAGEGVFQKNWTWMIRLYNGTEFFTTKFTNGMRLGALATSDLLV